MYRRAGRQPARPTHACGCSLSHHRRMCHGDDQFHTQSGFDLLWDHTYPGTMAIRVGLNAHSSRDRSTQEAAAPIVTCSGLRLLRPRPEHAAAAIHARDGLAGHRPRRRLRRLVCLQRLLLEPPGTEAGRSTADWPTSSRAHDAHALRMRNSRSRGASVQRYSQEAVDGLREPPGTRKSPEGVIRWWAPRHPGGTRHSSTPTYRSGWSASTGCSQGPESFHTGLRDPYVEHLHSKTRQALARVSHRRQARLPGPTRPPSPARKATELRYQVHHLVAQGAPGRGNQRRVRSTDRAIRRGPRLPVFAADCALAPVAISDPEVV